MNSNYKIVEVDARNIDDMVSELLAYHARGEKVSAVFNEKTFYSDTVTLDGAYLELTGKTKSEFDEFKRQEEKRIEERLSNPENPFHTICKSDKK